MRLKIFLPNALLLLLLAGRSLGQAPDPLPVTVHLDPAGEQVQPAAVIDSLGRMLVAWRDSSSLAERLVLQGFDPQGSRLGSEQTASLVTFWKASHPSLAVDYNGNAVVAWEETLGEVQRILFRRYNVFGRPKGSQPLPETIQRLIDGGRPATALDSIGNLVLVWQATRGAGGTSDIYGNWYAAADTLAVENIDSTKFAWIKTVKVNESETGEQTGPAVAADRKGNFLVAWRDSRPDSAGIFCRVFGAKGLALNGLRLPSGDPLTISDVSAPVAAAAGYNKDSTNFLISWVQRDAQGGNQLYLARVNVLLYTFPATVRLDSSLQVVRARPGLEFARPSLAANESWDITLVWSETDSDGKQIYGISGNFQNRTLTSAARLSQPGESFGTPADNPVAAVRRDGGFTLLWEDHSRPDSDLRMQRYDSAGKPLNPLFMAPGGSLGERSGYAALLARPAGEFTLFWEGELEAAARIRTATFDSSGRTVVQPGLLADNGWEQRRPVVAHNTGGQSLVAWEENQQNAYRISALLLAPDGGAVKSAFPVTQSSTSYLGAVAAALSDSGRAWLVWERWAPLASAPDLLIAGLDSQGDPEGSPAVVVSAANGGGRLASLAAAPDGSRIVVWRQGAAAGANAQIRARVYNPQGAVARDRIAVSEQNLNYLGSVSRSVAAASPVTGKFLVLWEEFFSDRPRLYYRLYAANGDSLDLGGGAYRRQLDTAVKGSGGQTSQFSPTVEVDSAGDHLVLWVEKEAGGSSSLLGVKIDSLGGMRGKPFTVPGVAMASLPAVRILSADRIAVAWQDTAGGSIRLLAVQLDFHGVFGAVALAGEMAGYQGLFVHIQGRVTDSVAVGPDGRFQFEGLIGGEYRLWLTRNGERLETRQAVFTLGASDGPRVDLGLVAELTGSGSTSLPRPDGLVLRQNAPNPFNPSTTVNFSIPGEGRLKVRLAVYDLRGALVKTLADGELESGAHSLVWDGRDNWGVRAASGIYFLRLNAGAESRVRKMILLK